MSVNCSLPWHTNRRHRLSLDWRPEALVPSRPTAEEAGR